MKLKEQVCSLESAKKLKELGFKQESLFWWMTTGKSWDTIKLKYIDVPYYILESNNYQYKDHVVGIGGIDNKKGKAYWNSRISAFTVAELGEIIKNHVDFIGGSDFDDGAYGRYEDPVFIGYCCGYRTTKGFKKFIADTEAEARAKMLIHLSSIGAVKGDVR